MEYSSKSRQKVTVFFYPRHMEDDILVESFEGRSPSLRISVVTETFPPEVNGVAMTLGRLTDGLKALGHRLHVTHTGQFANAGETCVQAVPLPGYSEVRVGLPEPFKLRKRWRKRWHGATH
jgi:hypothetical protein